jgi:glyceraldehyde 3-phosphate dehydrogenase
MATKVAINGLGRIGRTFFRMALKDPALEIVAVNDLGDAANLAYLLKYDSVYGRSSFDVAVEEGAFIVGGKRIAFLSEKDPTKLPWKDMGIDVVVESTGVFETYEKAKAHLTAGAKRVVLSAPVSGDPAAAGV